MRALSIMAVVLAAGCGSKEKAKEGEKQDGACDMSSEASIARLYKELEGGKTANPHCIRRPEAFPTLAYAGIFADDAGCMDEVQIWKCKRSSEKDLPEILQSAGWKTTDDAGRAQIAKDWLAIEGELLWVAAKPHIDDFTTAGKTFTLPKVTHDGGKVRIEGWFESGNVTVGGYMARYSSATIEFGVDGALSRLGGTDSFEGTH